MDRPKYSYDNAEIVGERLSKLFEGMDKEHTMATIEEFIDDYTQAIFGVAVVDHLRKVKLPGKGQCQTVQTLAGGRAMLVSSYGFNVKSDTECKCGRAFIVLDECNHKDFQQNREGRG